MALVELQHVCKDYRDRAGSLHPALRDLSFEVEEGEFAVVLGPSGAGKSTLLRLLGRLDTRYEGRLQLPPVRTGMVFQEPRLLPWLTAAGNVEFALRGSRAARRESREWLARVGLAPYERAYPHQLSGGMQQRVALARAFAGRPQLLLLDEPLSALDEVTAERVGALLLALWAETRPTVLMVTHRVEEAAVFADRVWVLTAGPGRVWTSIDVPLDRPRSRGPAFWAIVERSREALRRATESSGNGAGP
jgi:ABC-type nitrate/sulfonate/bicarbonate transport system ATPase subunit